MPRRNLYLLKTSDVANYFGSVQTAADFLGCTSRALYWRDGFVSEHLSLVLEKMTEGRLNARSYDIVEDDEHHEG